MNICLIYMFEKRPTTTQYCYFPYFFLPKWRGSVSFELNHFIFLNWNKTKVTALWKWEIKTHHRWWVSPLIWSAGWFWTNPYSIPFFWKISNQTLENQLHQISPTLLPTLKGIKGWRERDSWPWNVSKPPSNHRCREQNLHFHRTGGKTITDVQLFYAIKVSKGKPEVIVM